MDIVTLRQARASLIRIGLIAYKSPLYQVLDLDRCNTSLRKSSSSQGALQSLGHILRQIREDEQ